jgi:hypothetical protein
MRPQSHYQQCHHNANAYVLVSEQGGLSTRWSLRLIDASDQAAGTKEEIETPGYGTTNTQVEQHGNVSWKQT